MLQKIREIEMKHGPKSQAVYLLKFRCLVDLLQVYCDHDRLDLQVFQGLLASVQEVYQNSLKFLPRNPDVDYLSDHPPLMRYRLACYQKQYGSAHELHQHNIHPLEMRLEQLTTGATYLYLIDEHHQVLVYDRPLDLIDLLTARQKGNNPMHPVHPMLNWPTLMARGAGELTVVQGRHHRAFLANTKSGHYRPGPACADLLESLLRRFTSQVHVLRPPEHGANP